MDRRAAAVIGVLVAAAVTAVVSLAWRGPTESSSSGTTPRATPEIPADAVVGLWDDGRVGENTKLDLRADGSAHVVSLAVVPATWTFDAGSGRVTVTSRRQADGSTIEQHVTYVTGDDVLKGPFFGPGDPEHVFRRAGADAIAWWARVRPRVEAGERARSGR